MRARRRSESPRLQHRHGGVDFLLHGPTAADSSGRSPDSKGDGGFCSWAATLAGSRTSRRYARQAIGGVGLEAGHSSATTTAASSLAPGGGAREGNKLGTPPVHARPGAPLPAMRSVFDPRDGAVDGLAPDRYVLGSLASSAQLLHTPLAPASMIQRRDHGTQKLLVDSSTEGGTEEP